LSYVPKSAWAKWNKFLERKFDDYWPRVTSSGKSIKISMTKCVSKKRSVVDPLNALKIQVASMVASGKLEPDEAEFFVITTTENSLYKSTSSIHSDQTEIESDSESHFEDA
jgi:hypothetical protein